ncbi:MAG: hypothetical protein U0441_38220 [Polyangiaceae bacterium]
MRFTFGWTGALLGSALLAGCAQDLPEPAPSGDSTKQTTTVTIDATLAFDGPASIEVSPGENRAISVGALPAASYEIDFALIDSPSDASLDAATVTTGADGRATVHLHAPDAPSSFTLRAWIPDGPATELAISVNKVGVGSVQVIPDYSGPRPVDEWVASAVAGASCSDLTGQLPGEPKGALVATAPVSQNPLIQSVPVGPKVAVAVRAGHYAWGCTDVADLAAGASKDIKVHVVDVPPALDKTSLDLTLTYTPAPAAYSGILASAKKTFMDALLPPYVSSGSTLLDTMAALSADPVAFAAAREANGWDALADAHFAGLPLDLRARMEKWIGLGFGVASPVVSGQLAAIEGVPGKAVFVAQEIGGLSADAVGAPPVHLVSWTSQPNDKVVLSGTIYWLPSRFIGAACSMGATQDLGIDAPMSDALSKAAACSDLAPLLVGLDGCGPACLSDLCHDALASLWQGAEDASAAEGSVGTIDIDATGQIKVDDVALPIALQGDWLGDVSDGMSSAQASGTISGILSMTNDVPQDPAGDPPPQ